MKAAAHKQSLQNLQKAQKLIKKSVEHEAEGVKEMKRKKKGNPFRDVK